ncbi:hypothetical protein E3N88_15639 [Mikania micrantha]|uniref:Uncharacterized protein n=1 Tax=Mikania micrantha TaxID=192012 RepID=A0A5N6NW60_9ASTR|nr:hypothetical protein E3N88_15639 [Mikania micrantha]
MAGYKSVPKHNICAHLDLTTPNAKHYSDIITFLRRSRIFTAISTVHVPYHSHQQDFWSSADIDCEAEPTVIRGKVQGYNIVVSAEHIWRICGFQDSPDQPALLDRFLVRGCFLRCKYEGDIGAGILNKAFMSPQFKYLAHVLVHCLGSRRGGFDDMRETIQCAFAALVLNKPFNFSEMIFIHMKENVVLKGDKKFLMYPRFLQQIIDAQVPDLPKINADVIRLEHMNDTTLNRVLSYRGKERKPATRSLFGHLSRPDYRAPAGRRWRHADSDSDVEDIVVPAGGDDSDGDDGDDEAGPSGAGAGESTVIVSTAAVVSSGVVEMSSGYMTTAFVSMVDVSGTVTGGDAGLSTAQEEDIDVDSLMDLDFLATTTTAVTTATSVDATAPQSDDESEDSGDGEDGDDVDSSSDSEATHDDEFEKVMEGGKMEMKKRKRSEAEIEEITDPSFVPEFDLSPPPRSSAPVTVAVTAITSPPTSSRAGRGKRSRFSFQRRSELTTAATSTVTSVAAVSVSSLTRSRAIPAQTTTAPLTTPFIREPVYVAASSGPSTSRADTFIPTVSVVDQLSTLNSMVLRLMEKNMEQESKIAQLTQRIHDQDALLLQAADQRADLRARSAQQEEQLLKYIDEHNQLALTATGFNERILLLEAENARLAELVESSKEGTPRLEGVEVHSDDSDKEEEEEESEEEQVDYEDSEKDEESDDDAGDDKDGSGSGSSESSGTDDDDDDDNDDQAPPSSEIRSKKSNDKKAQAPPPSSPSKTAEPEATEEVQAVPLRRQLDQTLTMILDAQGIIQHSVSYDKEEGEIIHCLSKEQIAELFRLNPDEVVTDDTSVPIFEEPEPEPFDDVDEVILEDITDEEYPKYTSAEDELPIFTEPFDQETEDLLVRYLEEQVEASKAEADDQKRRKEEWVAYWEVLKKQSTEKMPATHKKVYRTKGYKAGGQILSWAYFHDLGCYAVKREKGIDYFKHPHDFKTLPGFEVNQLARLNMLYSEDSGMSAWFSRQIKYEYRKRWVNFQPQQPERYYLPEIDGDTRKHKVILKWLPPRVLKRIPLRKMRQDFMDGFRWWYYDGRTGEAVIVLCKDKKWETVRIFDPMWLTNLSHKDVQALFRNQIFFDVPDMVQALQFMRVIRLCSIFKIHAGADWKAISEKYFKKDTSKS